MPAGICAPADSANVILARLALFENEQKSILEGLGSIDI